MEVILLCAIFDEYINYANLTRSENSNFMLTIFTLQKKAIEIINNRPRNNHSDPLLKKRKTATVIKIIFPYLKKNSKNELAISYHKFSEIGLGSFLIFPAMIQSHSQLVNFLSLPIELTPMEKTIFCGIKHKI